jgi:site-specific DNA-cytosine methylase
VIHGNTSRGAVSGNGRQWSVGPLVRSDKCFALNAASPHLVSHPPLIAPALRGYGHGAQGQHNDDAASMGMVRRLTPLECERLQGFPDGWTAPTGKEKDSPRYRALGNAVAVPVVEWIARRLNRRMAMEADS